MIGPGRFSRTRASVALASAFSLAILGLASPASGASAVNCAKQSLQKKINAAAPGSTLLVKGTCHGNFLIKKKLVLDGNPTATLDGNDQGTTLTINTSASVRLIDLTIIGGNAAFGGGIYHTAGGALKLTRSALVGNVASGDGTSIGGGIYSHAGSIVLKDSLVEDNRAVEASAGGATAVGGGIYSGGPLTLLHSVVTGNKATARSSGSGATAVGGALDVEGKVIITNSRLENNRAAASSAASGATVVGGALNQGSASTLSITGSALVSSFAIAATSGGTSGATATGGAIESGADTITLMSSSITGSRLITTSAGAGAVAVGGALNTHPSNKLSILRSRITGSEASADGPGGAVAAGGGINNSGPLVIVSSRISKGTVTARSDSSVVASGGAVNQSSHPASVTRSTIDQNSVSARSSSSQSLVAGGGFYTTERFTMKASTVSRNLISAIATGAHQAQAAGAGLYLSGSATDKITNSTVASNVGEAKSSLGSGTATGIGGGILSSADSLLLTNATIARNLVGGSAKTGTFLGGGLYVGSGSATAEASILALNKAPTGGPNCFGPLDSSGHNVLGATSGCTFAQKPTDRVKKDPKLGALSNNGGPTLTLALLDGSPAINIIPAPDCAVPRDQRGVKRPQGPKCDSGAFERKT